ncbi:hypothetical protein DYB31_002953 [Aphanomyces astaci]|uniref:E3 ubiquitin-protein ligase CHFR n=1 Tax=Aphanomyces astaci TaxID=112090 RepID=A0A397FL62_APHAT|nr:hypothetical protein DYB31_002953 [Aphanomyces astaci]
MFTFDLTPVCIGRSRDCELSLSSDVSSSRVVSKKHARLYPCMFENNQQVRWFLKDLDSKHGTSVNGVDVKSDSSVQVFDGDVIVLARQSHPPHDDDQDNANPSSPSISIKCHLHGRGNALLTLITSTSLNQRHSALPHPHKPSHSTDKRKFHAATSSPRQPSSGRPPSDIVKKRFRSLEADPANHDESPLKCPVCFEFFVDSLTLACSHTFCGGCLRSWLLQSLTCPTCRVGVTDVPVHTRALDNLCMQLVDPTDAAWMLRQQTWHAEAARLTKKAKKIRHAFLETKALPWPNVWTTWHDTRDREVFSQTVSVAVGQVREAWCEAVGLTEAAIDSHGKAKLLVASSNLLVTTNGRTHRGDGPSTDNLRHRLRMFLRYG